MKLSISPLSPRADESIHVMVTDARPGSRVCIVAHLTDLEGVEWRSEGRYDADIRGNVDVSKFASVGGTYDGVDANGLLWSMLPRRAADAVQASSYPLLAPGQPHRILISAETSDASAEAVTIERSWSGQGVERRELSEDRLRGIFHEPPAAARRSTGVLVISGSDGGVSDTLAPLIASRGYPTLALAYFAYADLPRMLVDIPLEYFAEGAAWLRSRVSKVAVIGISRGAEAAALASAHFADFADALVLYVPSHVVETGIDPSRTDPVAAWTLSGECVPYVPPTQDTPRLFSLPPENGARAFTPVFLDKWAQPGAAERWGIPVEKIAAPILLLSAANDALWPSWIGAALLESRARNAGLDRVQHVSYHGAGHVISRPGVVTSLTSMYHQHGRTFIALGGVPRLAAAAALAAYERTVSFLASV